MNYISTKELSQKWNISVSRIVRLAKEGRIPGATLVGKSWLFPSDVCKPADKRMKNSNLPADKPKFRFPLYLYTPYSEAEIANDFTEEERRLYQGELQYYNGDYQQCHLTLTTLLETVKDPYVRFGTIYYLCLCDIYLRHYHQAWMRYHEINMLFAKEPFYQAELEFPIHDLESFFSGNNYYIRQFRIDPGYHYPSAMREYILLESAFSDALHSVIKKVYCNPAPYELVCQADPTKISMLSKIMLHTYCSLIYVGQGMEQKDRILYHLNEACRLAEENRLEHSMAYILYYVKDFFIEALRDTNPALFHRLRNISVSQNEAFHKLLDYKEKNTLFQNISANDYKYIIFAVEGLTNKEIAARMHLSTATINKKYSSIYEKTGVHSKDELVRICREHFADYA